MSRIKTPLLSYRDGLVFSKEIPPSAGSQVGQRMELALAVFVQCRTIPHCTDKIIPIIGIQP